MLLPWHQGLQPERRGFDLDQRDFTPSATWCRSRGSGWTVLEGSGDAAGFVLGEREISADSLIRGVGGGKQQGIPDRSQGTVDFVP